MARDHTTRQAQLSELEFEHSKTQMAIKVAKSDMDLVCSVQKDVRKTLA